MTPDKVEAALGEMREVGQHQEVFGDRIHEWAAVITSALAEARDGWEMANGVAELAMKHRDAAEAALAERERDAARYRWLTKVVLSVDGHGISWTWGNGSLDAVIDAAIKDTDHAR